MSKGQQTKDRVVDAALSQAVISGLEGLSFGALAEDAGMSKSGLFAHFASKEDLQLQVLERAISLFTQKVVEPAMRRQAGLERLTALFNNFLDWIAGDAELPGCPFVTFVQEFDDRRGVVRDLLQESQEAWRNLLAATAGDAQALDQISRDASPQQIAFELVGAALSYQSALKMHEDKAARRKAVAAFSHILR